MGRKPGTTCTSCNKLGTRAEMKRDGGDGYRCKVDCAAKGAAPSAVDEPHPGDAADAAAKARVAAASPKTAARLASEAASRAAAHRETVLAVLGPRPATRSYSPAEIARMCGVPADEIDAVIAAMLGDGALEEMSDEEGEEPTYRAKPKATIVTGARVVAGLPGGDRKRVNRKGKPTVVGELARTCRVCSCTAEAPCDTGDGRSCCWSDVETPATGDVCSACAGMLDMAREALAEGTPVADLAKALAEDAPPCVTSARIGKAIEIVVASLAGASKKRDTVAAPPAQVPIPGLGAARNATLPFPREPLAVVPTDPAPAFYAAHPAPALVAPRGPFVAMALAHPCDVDLEGCGAAPGEPCAWATAEPASFVHDARRATIADPGDRAALVMRATEDRTRALVDYYAGLPSVHPMPVRAAIVRALTIAGDPTSAPAIEMAIDRMTEQGELRWTGEGATACARRAQGSAPVEMGRVGVKVPAMREADRPALEAALADPEVAEGAAAALDAMGPAHLGGEPCGDCAALDEGPVRAAAAARIGGYAGPDAVPPAPVCNICKVPGGYSGCGACGPRVALPSEPVDDAGPLLASPVESALVDVQEAAQALARVRGHLGTLLGAEVRERAAVAQLDAVQRERDEARAEVAAAHAELAEWIKRAGTSDVTRERDEALVRRDAAENAIRELSNAFGVPEEASPMETCAAVARRAAEDRARVAPLRAGLERAFDVLTRASERSAESRSDTKLVELVEAQCWQALEVEKALRAERGDAERIRDGLAARVLTLRAGIVAAIDEPPANPSALDDAALVALLVKRSTLDGVVATAVLQLSGEAPPAGKGCAPLAAALGDAVRAVLAERAEASRRAVAVAAVTAHAAPTVTEPPPENPTPPGTRRARSVDFT